ncbi:MAG: cation:proton antiporter [Candidatus Micrarchaeota archaeon]
MVAESNPLMVIGIILVFSWVLSFFFKRIGQNPVVGFIVSGFLLGPFVFHILTPETPLVQAFSELGLFVLLFYLGIELSFRDFVKAGVPTLGLALADMSVCFLAGFLIALMAGFSLLFSAAVGLMMFSTSSAIVGKFLVDRGLIRKKSSQMALAILILQDFLGILVLVFISSVSSSGSALDLALTAVVFAGVSFYAVHRLSKFVETYFERYHLGATELTVYALAVALVVSALGSFLKLNPALGAYFAGFALSELSVGEKVKEQIGFSRDFFLMFFFVSFGASLFYNSVSQTITFPAIDQLVFLVGLSIVLGIVSIIVHGVVLTMMGPLFNISNRESSEMAILLSPLGEFVIIIAISIIPILAVTESLSLAPIAFLLILATLLIFQPLYNHLNWHDRITQKIPAFASRVHTEQPKTEHSSESIQWLKTLAKNLLLLVCLAWLTLQLYRAIPTIGIPIPFSREIFTVLVFAFFAYIPVSRSLRAFRKIIHAAQPSHYHHHGKVLHSRLKNF